MKSTRLSVVAVLLIVMQTSAMVAGAQQNVGVDLDDLAAILTFERTAASGFPTPWRGGPVETVFVDSEVVRSGSRAARIERDEASENTYSALTLAIPVTFSGERLALEGYLRTQDVEERTGLWMRVDGDSGALAFDNMRGTPVSGTTGWTEHRIELPLSPEARAIVFGGLLMGRGKAWFDDLTLLVDGRPVTEAPKVVRAPTVLDLDTEFREGSRIELSALTPARIDNIATLAKVWGFLKYHHPRIARGELHFDYELFRALPTVLAAADASERNAAILAWAIERIGEPGACDPCASAPQDVRLLPDIDWIRDRDRLGDELSRYLERVHRNRFAEGPQFYVTTSTPGAMNAIFSNESAYPSLAMPDVGYRLLALFRLWNIIEYWFPYRDVIGEPWDRVLHEFIPAVAAPRDPQAYALAMAMAIARINDTHAEINRSDLLPPRGACSMPTGIRFIEGRPIVSAFLSDGATQASGFEIGDVIEAIGDEPMGLLLEDWVRYYSGSNTPAKLRGVAANMTRGECASVPVAVRRRDFNVALNVERIIPGALNMTAIATHDRRGETFQRLGSEVAYLKLSTISAADVPRYIEDARGTRGLVIDIRSYPGEFVVFALGRHLVRETTPFAAFTHPDLTNPGAFVWEYRPSLEPAAPYYDGKIVILVDEVTLSQAEYTAMALRAAPNALVVGSTTAGADGDVSSIVLPGGLRTRMSGLGVFYPDGNPTQRVGIVPDVLVMPTIEGLREGRDEVLEQALREILGESADEAMIREIAHRPEA